MIRKSGKHHCLYEEFPFQCSDSLDPTLKQFRWVCGNSRSFRIFWKLGPLFKSNIMSHYWPSDISKSKSVGRQRTKVISLMFLYIFTGKVLLSCTRAFTIILHVIYHQWTSSMISLKVHLQQVMKQIAHAARSDISPCDYYKPVRGKI